MNLFKRVVAIMISLTMMASAGATASAKNDGFIKAVLIDCGRGAYSLQQIKTIINKMADYDYNCLMLGFGNDGLRFLLDDMSVAVGDKAYDSETIKAAVIKCNDRIAPDSKGQLTQADMDEIMSLTAKNNIEVIPMLDIPGHATAITEAMTACGIEDSSFIVETGKDDKVVVYNLSVNIENETAKAFTSALVLKYVDYFKSKGCRFFNLGCDEYGGNAEYLNAETIAKIRDFIADICNRLPEGVTPMAFTDVLTKADSCPEEIIGINWAGGKLEGHRMMNANSGWYYVLGATGFGWSAYDLAMKNTKEIPVTQMINDPSEPLGSIFAVWNDNYLPADEYMDKICDIIVSQAVSNPDYFETKENSTPAKRIIEIIKKFFASLIAKIRMILL